MKLTFKVTRFSCIKDWGIAYELYRVINYGDTLTIDTSSVKEMKIKSFTLTIDEGTFLEHAKLYEEGFQTEGQAKYYVKETNYNFKNPIKNHFLKSLSFSCANSEYSAIRENFSSIGIQLNKMNKEETSENKLYVMRAIDLWEHADKIEEEEV